MLELALVALARYRRLDAPAPDVVLAELCVGASLPLHPVTELQLLLGPLGLLNEVCTFNLIQFDRQALIA